MLAAAAAKGADLSIKKHLDVLKIRHLGEGKCSKRGVLAGKREGRPVNA
jgi:hypothetical protein